MATTSAQKAFDDIIAYVKSQRKYYQSWYCGITSDIETRLFGEHGVSREGVWIHTNCDTAADARAVEKALIENGFQGGSGGGDQRSNIVYAYLITPTGQSQS